MKITRISCMTGRCRAPAVARGAPDRYGLSSMPWPRVELERSRIRTAALPRVRKDSDNPSDNDPRQHQTGDDTLRH